MIASCTFSRFRFRAVATRSDLGRFARASIGLQQMIVDWQRPSNSGSLPALMAKGSVDDIPSVQSHRTMPLLR